jgi:hypothetical protein
MRLFREDSRVEAFPLDLQAVGYNPFVLDGRDWQPARLFTLFAASRAHRTASQSVRDFPPDVSYQPGWVVTIGGRRKAPSGIPRYLRPGREGARAHSRRPGSKRRAGLGCLPRSGVARRYPRVATVATFSGCRVLGIPWRPIHPWPVRMARCLLSPLRCGTLSPRGRGLDGRIERQVPAPLSGQAEPARGSSPGVAAACSSCQCAGSPT